MPKSTTHKASDKASIVKAARVYKQKHGIPLAVHATGRWMRKVNGRLHYFGKVDGNAKDFGAGVALDEHNRTIEHLRAGRTPPPPPAEDHRPTVKLLCNEFYKFKKAALEAGEITARTFREYEFTTDLIVAEFGRHRALDDLRPEDFAPLRQKLARRYGPVRLGNTIQRVRTVFKFGQDSEIMSRTINWKVYFAKPKAAVLRRNRARRGSRLFDPEDLRQIIAAANPNMRAMALLACNGGLGNSDVASLPLKPPIDKNGILTWHREKTGIARRIPLWPETMAAIDAARKARPEPGDLASADLLFIGNRGTAYLGERTGNRVTQLFKRTKADAGVDNDLTFYDLRRTFETIAGDTGDQVSVDAVMGHAPPSADMASVYRQRVADARLRAVVEHVRAWLWPVPKNPR